MSNVARVAGQAANTLVKPLEVEDVFSTYLYTGNGSTQTITNGIDGSEGALVWIKNRDNAFDHILFDTGQNTNIETNNTNAGQTSHDTTITSTGFSLNNGDGRYNVGAQDYVSWTFRKAPKFFDVVTYTGDGTTNRQISHNLGSTPASIIVKCTSASTNWVVYHKDLTNANYCLILNSTLAQISDSTVFGTAPTDTVFTVARTGVSSNTNQSGQSYVAYLFAHNDGDGDFGPDGDADIIKCGSFTGNQAAGNFVDLGFEPQFLLLKNASATEQWFIFDNMRGVVTGGADARLRPSQSNAESSYDNMTFNATGFTPSSNAYVNGSGHTMVYIAIRRPTAVPTSATEVFDVQTSTSANFVHTTGFDVDLAITGSQDGWARNAGVVDRLRGDGKSLETSNTDAESAGNAGVHEFDRSREYLNSSTSGDQVAWAWKRAPKYMDVVAYTGNGTAGHTVSHNLTVAPEMMWVKRRNGVSSWITYWEPLGATKGVFIDTNAAFTSATYWNDTAPTDSVFTLGNGSTNTSSATFIAYLFATLANISKVGSFSHTNGTNSVVDCGFTSGARFVLLKRTDSADNWDLWDSARGINTGTEPKLVLNTTSNESVTDEIDPDGSGFIYASGGNTGDYIFYAIA